MVIVNVPLVVIGLPDIVIPVPAVAATLVTVPTLVVYPAPLTIWLLLVGIVIAPVLLLYAPLPATNDNANLALESVK